MSTQTDMHEIHCICPAGLLGLHGLSFTVKPWASKGTPVMYERSCQALTWSKSHHRTFSVTCSLPWWSHVQSSDSYHVPRTIVQKVSCRMCCQRVNLSSLRSHSLSCRTYSLAVALHARSHGLALAVKCTTVGVDLKYLIALIRNLR